MTEEITSAANPLIKRMRLLADRKHRRREGAFVVQGIQPVWQAVEAGAPIEALIVAPDLLTVPAAGEMVATAQSSGTRVVQVPAALFTRLADRDGPSGLAAIVRTRPSPLDGLPVLPGSVFVALHEVGNPGNLGTIIRTASAAGAGGVVLVGPSTDPYDPAAVKASMGALFSVPVTRAGTADEFFAWARRRDISVAVTSARGAATVWESPLPRPVALLLGSEGAGLPADMLARGDVHVRIPMTGTAESLNLAVAAGILLYETVRRDGLPG
ncbi:MAG: TrmH family RNA methyltransferase [Streptosporangiaceae bacterium]|jgi:TrmH family RNA methyltransferase